MNKLNTLESVQPCSKEYSWKTDLKLNAWFAVAGVVWACSLQFARSHPDAGPAMRGAVALAPLLPGMLYVRDCMRFIRGLDELQRRIQMESWMFAALGTLMVLLVVNVLAANHVTIPSFPKTVEFGGAVCVMLVLWLVGGAIANCRYK